MPDTCDCTVDCSGPREPHVINYCILHDAAEEMLTVLRNSCARILLFAPFGEYKTCFEGEADGDRIRLCRVCAAIAAINGEK